MNPTESTLVNPLAELAQQTLVLSQQTVALDDLLAFRPVPSLRPNPFDFVDDPHSLASRHAAQRGG